MVCRMRGNCSESALFLVGVPLSPEVSKGWPGLRIVLHLIKDKAYCTSIKRKFPLVCLSISDSRRTLLSTLESSSRRGQTAASVRSAPGHSFVAEVDANSALSQFMTGFSVLLTEAFSSSDGREHPSTFLG